MQREFSYISFLIISLGLSGLGFGQGRLAENPASRSALEQVAYIHGAAGPFAVAGYRIGQRALKELGTPRSKFTLSVVHKTPMQVQWSCVADGVQAATGVSVGKLSLKLEEVSEDKMETIVSDRSTGKQFVFRLTASFSKRFFNLPHDQLAHAGEEVLAMSDEDIFTISPSPNGPDK